jgi:ectoine hydroxylase-related dioxygenase (phytanoyl-CoA dioxygenase family)
VTWQPTSTAVAHALAEIQAHGVVLLHEVYDPAWIATVAAAVDALFDATAAAAADGTLSEPAAKHYEHQAIDLQRLELDQRLVADDLAAPLTALAAALMQQPAARHPYSFLRRVSADDTDEGAALRLPFHQDERVLDRPLVNAWIPFVACGRDRPGLEVVRQPLDAVVPAARHDRSIYGRAGVEIPAPIVRAEYRGRLWAPELNAGDVLVFPGTTIHRSHVTKDMAGTRTSVDLRFVPAGSL